MLKNATDTHRWDCRPISVDPLRLLSVHKYRDPKGVRPRIRRSADAAIERAMSICAPEAHYVSLPVVSLDERGIELKGDVRFDCEAFTDKLDGAMELLVFVLTLGEEIDQEVTRGFTQSEDPLAPLFLDTAGWLMIEAVTREFSRHLKERQFENGNALSLRMAPGYSYRIAGTDRRVEWPLEDQAKLIGCFQSEPLPVQLLSSGAMVPRMSRSGVFGVKPGI